MFMDQFSQALTMMRLFERLDINVMKQCRKPGLALSSRRLGNPNEIGWRG